MLRIFDCKWFKTVLLCLAIFLLSASYVSAATVELTFLDWRTPAQAAASKAIFEKFEATHPGIKINYQPLTWAEYTTKVITMVAAGTPPDVLSGTGPKILDLYNAGLTMDLGPFMKRDRFTYSGQYGNTAFPSTTVPVINGSYYAIPYAATLWTAYYNVNKFDEAGLPYPPKDMAHRNEWTWEGKFREYAKRLTRDVNGDGVNDQFGIGDLQMYDSYPLFWGGSWISVDGKRFLGTDEPVVKALDFVQQTRVTDRVFGGNFAAGTAAMAIAGNWYAADYAKGIKDSYKWAAAPIPMGASEDIRGGFDALWIVNGSKHPEESWELIKFLSSPEQHKSYVVDTLALLPTHKDSTVRRYYVQGMMAKGVPEQVSNAFIDIVGNGKFFAMPYNVPGKNDLITKALQPHVDKVLAGTIPARQAMEQVASAIQELLAK